MSAPLESHPLVAPFWGKEGVRYMSSDSMTLSDFSYQLRLDDAAVEFEEREHSPYHDIVDARVIKGTWAAMKVEPEKVVLRLSGVDAAGAPSERILVISPDDMFSCDVEWGLNHHS
jgi:hypothetical protein